MDPYNLRSGSWPLIKKNLPSLIGFGVGHLAATIRASARAHRQVKADSAQRFPTWSEKRSPMAPPRFRRAASRRRAVFRRRPFVPRSVRPMMSDQRVLVRSSDVGTGLAVTAGTWNSIVPNITLSLVQTSDLTAAYRLYRIRKVVVRAFPQTDPANSSLATNVQCVVGAACDPEGTTAPGSLSVITAYDNSYHKVVSSGGHFRYTFYPKVVNTVDLSGTATAAGSYGLNPWLQLNATGITIPHRQLLLGINCATATTLRYNVVYDIHFEVKGMA